MDLNEQPHESNQHLDLVGGPFAVVESDPGVFTSLTRKLGVRGIELVEVYDIEPWAVDHLNPYGLIFCFLWKKDAHRPADFEDPAAERVWFANQLSNDACASLAILNVLLNCPNVHIGDELYAFKQETERMSPVMKGLAFTNLPLLRTVHNSLSRPADIRGALNSIALTTLDEEKAKTKTSKNASSSPKRGREPPPQKRAKTKKATESAAAPTKSKVKPKNDQDEEDKEEDTEEAYHFIGYVPAYGKVWELDGLKSGPLEVGELSLPSSSSSPRSRRAPNAGWMDIVRPALRMKMEKYGGAAEGGDNIRFSLLAIVDGLYEEAADQLQLLRREREALERRMGEGWNKKVDPEVLSATQHAFHAPPVDKLFATDFGSRRMSIDLQVLEMPEENLVPAWETCARNTVRAGIAVEDELNKAVRANTDHIKRTFDYEPFFKVFIEKLQFEGHLSTLLGKDEGGKKKSAKS